MATVSLSAQPILQFFNNLGQPNAGGSVLTQVANVNYPTYQDSAGAVPLPNPIPLNSRGEISNAAGATCQLFLVAGATYTFTIYDAQSNQIDSATYVYGNTPLAAASGANSDITSLTAVTSIANPSGWTANYLTSINSGPLYGSRAINGACEISQVNGTTAVTPTANGYVIDQFFYALTQASKLTFQQVADAPAGLKNSLKVTVAAQFSPAATDTFTIRQFIEGQNIIDFQLGTAGAVIITLSNWIKAGNAGTYAAYLRNGATNRSYVGTIAVTSAWTQVKLTLTGDVTGTWATDTTIGLEWGIDLGSGSNFNTTAGAWQAGSFTRTSGTGTFVAQANGSTMNITGLDVRLGSVAPTVFERRGVREELRRCQEYWCKSYDLDIAPATITAVGAIGNAGTNAASGNVWCVRYPVSMRANPTIALYSPVTGTSAVIANLTAAADTSAVAAVNVGKNGFANIGLALTLGNAYSMHFTADARL